MTTSPTPTPTANSEAVGVDPVIRAAQARSLISFNTTRLIEAAETLVNACADADAREELDMEIDGSMMDAVNDAITDLREAQALQPHPSQQAGTEVSADDLARACAAVADALVCEGPEHRLIHERDKYSLRRIATDSTLARSILAALNTSEARG